MTLDWHIVRWVRDHHRCLGVVHQAAIRGLIERAAAKDPMLAEQPEIADAAHGGPRIGRRDVVVPIGLLVLRAFDE
jgi:hypothetical protein